MRCGHHAGVIALVAAASLVHAEAPPRVVLVEPSGSRVPASLLRLSIRFAKPVEGAVLPRLSLRHADGATIAEPFLEQELWSPDDRTLTVLLHPGRVKTGLQARDTLGPLLVEGDDVVLALDGRPLHQWNVDPVDESGPRTSAWRLSPVHAGSREALVVALDSPVDGQAANYLAIADARGRRVPGRAQLTNGESTWTFTPDRPWQAREYRLLVRGTLEDSSGNRVGSHFETSLSSPAAQAADSVIPFDASPPSRPISR